MAKLELQTESTDILNDYCIYAGSDTEIIADIRISPCFYAYELRSIEIRHLFKSSQKLK